MNPSFLVVERPASWKISLPAEVRVITPREYCSDRAIQNLKRARVFNLCRDYSYQSAGYYVSLLAEARGHRPLPSVSTLRNFHGRPPVPSQDYHQIVQKSLGDLQGDSFTLSVYFGRNLAHRHDRLARALFNLFPAPLLRAQFTRSRDGNWRMRSVGPIAARDIPGHHEDFVREAAERYLIRPTAPQSRAHARYTLAILVDPEDATPPSDEAALKAFVRAAARQKIAAEFIGPDDIGTLAQFDALFIRATTSVENYTFRFARRAAAEGIPVIDDPDSILRCTNKVFLAELFQRHRIPAPRTEILYAGTDVRDAVVEALGLPLVIKQPDSAFSQGVVKVRSLDEFRSVCERMFGDTDLLIAQEFTPTEFDWRIGVLDGKPLFACRYHMARGHWQIYKQTPGAKRALVSGAADTLPVADVPAAIVETALRATALIGDGLYGVDLKEIDGRPLVIEVNDNPSIDRNCEDVVLKDRLYDAVIASLVRRIESRTAPGFSK